MQSLADSIKNELFDQLFDSINQEFGIKKASTIPPDERMYIIYDTDEEVIAKKIADRQAYIEEKYGKQKKTDPPIMFITFTKPKPLPDETSNQYQATDMLIKKTPPIAGEKS